VAGAIGGQPPRLIRRAGLEVGTWRNGAGLHDSWQLLVPTVLRTSQDALVALIRIAPRAG